MAATTLLDPIGRSITLHGHTWHGHIIKRHPEMKQHRLLVLGAVTNPLEIRVSDADPDCRLYFGVGPRAGIMTAVVVDVVRGLVKTAHLVRSMKGAVEWSQLTP